MIKIKCFFRNALTEYNVTIFRNNRVVIDTCTNNLGEVFVNLKPSFYIIKIVNKHFGISYTKYFYVCSNTHYLFFSNLCQCRPINSNINMRNFILYDQNYQNLKIMEGELDLWQV